MDLLTNAVESIQVGVEDYAIATRPRLLSAVRNIVSGILLLYKEALLRRSPAGSDEALIKAKLDFVQDVTGAITVRGAGPRTVDVQQIKERFASLGITTDTKLLDKIVDLRNQVEHYYPKLKQDAIRGLVASAFVIIRDFAERELGVSPRALLGQSTWDAMLQANDLYQAERRDCDAALQQVVWESDALAAGVNRIRCEACGSDLLQPVDTTVPCYAVVLACRACDARIDAVDFVPAAVQEGLSWEAYLAATDGGDEPYAICPDCGVEAYVLEEDRCAYCGESTTRECARCGNAIPPSEMDLAPLCGYCAHMAAKDD